MAGPAFPAGAGARLPEGFQVILGAVLCRERTEPFGHREDAAWTKFWSIKSHLTPRAGSQRARLQRLRTEVVWVFMRGNAAWHLRRRGIAKSRNPHPYGQMVFAPFSPRKRELGRVADLHMAKGRGSVDHLLGLHSRRCRCDLRGG